MATTNTSTRNNSTDTNSCPICLDSLSQACETSCGHKYCTSCLLSFWESLPASSTKTCPLDRQLVSFVIPLHEQNQNRDAALDKKLQHWNGILNEQQQQESYYDTVQENAHLLQRFSIQEGQFGKFVLCCIVFVLIMYTMSPVDLIPDVIPVIGLLDDLLLWVVVLLVVIPKLYRRYLLQRAYNE